MEKSSAIIKAILILLLMSACNDSFESRTYLDCYSSKNRELILKLDASFDRFIENNFDGSINEMLRFLEKGDSHKEFIYDQSDQMLFEELISHRFHEIAYSIEEIDLQENKWQYSADIQIQIDQGTFTNNWNTEVNIEGKYFKCLSKSTNKIEWVRKYLFDKSNMGYIPTDRLAKGLINNARKDVDKHLIKHILIVEIYYFLLKSNYNKIISN